MPPYWLLMNAFKIYHDSIMTVNVIENSLIRQFVQHFHDETLRDFFNFRFMGCRKMAIYILHV